MPEQKVFVASDENKGKAKQMRMFAFLAWILAIGGELAAIFYLLNNEMLKWLIITIVGILILSIAGSLLWKKANRLDPASEKDKAKFFIQSQLGAIMAVASFLPLVILIFTNKNLDKKSKTIAGIIGVVGLLVAGIAGTDFNPPSVEKYTQQINEQTDVVKQLNFDKDHVFWTHAGTKYHIYEDCPHIKGRDGISNGTVKDAWTANGISELCKTCEKRAEKENNVQLPGEISAPAIDNTIDSE